MQDVKISILEIYGKCPPIGKGDSDGMQQISLEVMIFQGCIYNA